MIWLSQQNFWLIQPNFSKCVRALENHVRVDESCKNIVNVTCFDVLEGGFRAFMRNTFRSGRKLSVCFAGELV